MEIKIMAIDRKIEITRMGTTDKMMREAILLNFIPVNFS